MPAVEQQTRSTRSAASPRQGGRLGRALRRHPGRVGLGLLLSLTAAVLLAQAAQGRVPFGPRGELVGFESIMAHVLLVAYLPAAYLGLMRRAGDRLATLRNLHTGVGGAALAALPRWSGRAHLAAALAGTFLGIVGPYLTQPYLDSLAGFWDPTRWNPEVVWHRGLGLVAGTGLGWFCFALVRSALDFSRVARQLQEIDIFDLSPLRPFMQQGLTSGLLAAGMLSLLGLFAVGTGINPMLILVEGSSIVLVSSALVLPVRGVHGRIRAAKRLELARCERAIEQERRHVLQGDAGASRGRLADLLAYRALVEGVREWPVDSPAIGRVALYLLIPIGSWVASALVQHVVERAMALP